MSRFNFSPAEVHNLTFKRAFLLIFILLQASLLIGHLMYQRVYIENNAARILRNTALLESERFQTSLDAMHYQVQVIGDALLLNHTVTPEHAQPYLAEELKRIWLDGVIIFDDQGNFIAERTLFPLRQVLAPVALMQRSFRERPLFIELRREDVTERLFYWKSEGDNPGLNGFVMYRAVRDPQGRYLGGIAGIFNSRAMEDMFQERLKQGFDLGEHGAMAILDPDADIELARMQTETYADLTRKNSAPGILMNLAGDTAQIHHYVSPIDGVSRMGVFLNLNERNWVLAVGLAEKDVLHGWYFQAFWTALAIIVIAVTQWLLLHYMLSHQAQENKVAAEARHDPLTGLANRRNFDEWVLSTGSKAQQYPLNICVVSIDLDFFKKINDSFGHDGGDAVLRCVGAILPELVRPCDIAARFGGEEFVVAMADTDLTVACQVAERIRMTFAWQSVEHCDQIISFTASFGIAHMACSPAKISEGIQELLARADRALYRAKREGRNRCCVAEE